MRTERCETCRFWKPNSLNATTGKTDGGYGFCRRYPPQVFQLWDLQSLLINIATRRVSSDSDRDKMSGVLWNEVTSGDPLRGEFPSSSWDDWCGEWQPTPSQATHSPAAGHRTGERTERTEG